MRAGPRRTVIGSANFIKLVWFLAQGDSAQAQALPANAKNRCTAGSGERLGAQIEAAQGESYEVSGLSRSATRAGPADRDEEARCGGVSAHGENAANGGGLGRNRRAASESYPYAALFPQPITPLLGPQGVTLYRASQDGLSLRGV